MYLTFYGLVCGCVGVSGGKGTVCGVACFLFFFHPFFPFARWGWGGVEMQRWISIPFFDRHCVVFIVLVSV